MQRKKKIIANRAVSDINRFQGNRLDPLNIGPDDLFDKTRKVLSELPEENRESLRDQILRGLRKAGVNIASALLMLGVLARTPDDLTPPDIGMLLRYVRLNTPEALKAVAGPLAQLLSPEATPSLQLPRKAA